MSELTTFRLPSTQRTIGNTRLKESFMLKISAKGQVVRWHHGSVHICLVNSMAFKLQQRIAVIVTVLIILLTRHLTMQSRWFRVLAVCLPYQVEDLHLRSSTDLSRRTGCLCIFDESTNLGVPSTITDVPEPSTLAIFALGLIGLASHRFKKQS